MNSIPIFKRTRIAPTPSGFLHAGNLASFLLTRTLATKTGARLFLRIDDLDRLRMKYEYLQNIFDSLNFMGIEWDEGPGDAKSFEKEYSQIHRMPVYRNALDELRRFNKVFACTCSRTSVGGSCQCREKNIPLDEKEVAWRLDTSGDRLLTINVFGGSAVQARLPYSMRDFVVRKKDGFPSYQLVSLIDDLHFEVDLIVRGEDLWESTLAQLYLAESLGKFSFKNTVFLHHKLIIGNNGQKLSKSAGNSAHEKTQNWKLDREEIRKCMAKISLDFTWLN
jgi:glutamyl/glutaminyl-tRNA synthetase